MTDHIPLTIVDDIPRPDLGDDRKDAFLLIVSSSIYTDVSWRIRITGDGGLHLPDGMTTAEAVFLATLTTSTVPEIARAVSISAWARATLEKWAPWELDLPSTDSKAGDGCDG